MGVKSNPERSLTAAAMRLAAIRPWHQVTWREIAAEAGLSLEQAHGVAADKAAILELLSQQIDQAILAEPKAQGEGGPRERLEAVIWRRFTLLRPYRQGLASVARSAPQEPATALTALRSVGRASKALLIAAAIPTEGLRGGLRVKGLSAIWLVALRTFLRDESEELAETHAVLTRQLDRAEGLLQRLKPRRQEESTT